MFGLKKRLRSADRPKLERDERVIAWAPVAGSTGRPVVVTTRGVFLPDHERLGWHQIHKAAWAGPRLTVTPAVRVGAGEGYEVMADDAPVEVALASPDDVPAEVRKRVTASVAYTEHHELPGGGVRVVGRRVAGRNGLAWHVRYDPGTDAADPEIVAATSALVADAVVATTVP